MTTFIRCIAAVAFLTVGMRGADAGNMFVLGDLLSGNPVSSSDGAHNPFNLYDTSFVGMNASTTGYYNSTGLGVTNGDQFVGVTAFGDLVGSLSSSITAATGTSVGAGYGALIFAGDVVDADSTLGNFNLTTSTGGVATALAASSGASSNFLSLVVSETVDFNTSSLVDIGNALENGSALELASFNISATNNFTTVTQFNAVGTFVTPTIQDTTFKSRYSLSLDVASSVSGIEFWTIDREVNKLFDVESSNSSPSGSFGSELYLNLLDVVIGVDINTGGTSGVNAVTSGNAVAAMNAVPEPSMLAVMGCVGVAGVVARRRKTRKTA